MFGTYCKRGRIGQQMARRELD